jgi:CRP/FNR family transcriptional regulator, cyclic AMP receptor protein
VDGANKTPFNVNLFLATVGTDRRLVTLQAKGVAFSQGTLADSVFYLQAGRAELTVVSERGKEATVTLLAPGDFFGEEAMTSADVLRTATATALTTCNMLRIERSEMLRVLHEEHDFSDFFLKYILIKIARTQADLVDQLFNSSERRLARTLLLMAEFGQPGEPETLLPPVTQEALAEMIGTTRSRVSFFMNRFRKLGYINYNGRIRVHKSLLNVVLHDQLPEQNASRPKMVDAPSRPAPPRDNGLNKIQKLLPRKRE